MKESDIATLSLFDRCMQEAVDMKLEQMQIASPFFDGGTISDVMKVCDEFYNGFPWERMGSLPSWKSRPDDGKCFQVVEAYSTKLTDSRPRCGFTPRDADDFTVAKVVQGYFDYWWESAKGAMALYLAVKDSRKFGTGFLHLEWSPSKRVQVLHAEHPEVILVDPDCTIDDFDPTYLIYEYVAQTGSLKETFPNAPWDDFQQNKPVPAFWDRILKRFNVNTTVKNPAKSTTVYEFWIRDAATTEFDINDDEYTLKVKKPKYPGGRVLTIAGGIVLSDEPNPYKHGKFPFLPISAYPETGKMWCHGDISRLIPTVMLNNRMTQYLVDATLKSTGGIYLVNKLMGLAKTSITNDIVQVREVKDVNQALRVVQPPSPPRHMFDMKAMLDKTSDDIAGQHEQSKGAFTPGNKTVAEVNIMAESDNTRARLASRFLGITIEALGHMWLSNVAQFEDKDMIIRITDDDGKPESIAANPATLLRAEPIADSEGKVIDWETLPFDVRVADTSTLPARQQELAQQAIMLAQGKFIDSESLLEVLDWPDRKAIQFRVKAAEEAAMQQQMAMQQAQQASQGAPQAPQPPDNGGMAPEAEGEAPMPQMPPEVMDQVQQIADATGVPVEIIIEQLMEKMNGGGMNDTAYPDGVNPGVLPVPEMPLA